MIDEEKIIEELEKKYSILEEVSFNEFNYKDKLMENSSLYIKYNELWLKEKSQLEYYENLLIRLAGKIFDHYRFESEKSLSKIEIEKYYIPNDNDYIKLQEIIAKQKIIVDFFDMCKKSIDKLQWNINSFIKGE